MLKLYYADVSDLPDQADGLALSEYRREKLASCRNVRMRKQQIGAELLLLWALRQEGVLNLPPEISVLPGGKPVLANLPLQFSLSHSGDFAACAVSDRAVGLDLEREGRYRESLLRRCCSPDELMYIRESEDPDAAFTRLWTGKESMLKLGGTGIRDDLALVQPFSPDPRLRIWHARLPACGPEGAERGGKETGYQLSVCFDAREQEPEGLVFVPARFLSNAFRERNGSET